MELAFNGALRLPLTVVNETTAAISCEGCGVCCREQPLPPFLDEIDFIPPELQREVIEAQKMEAELTALARPCIWQSPDTGKCMHYEHRPNICREYETGGELCLEMREKVLARDGVLGRS